MDFHRLAEHLDLLRGEKALEAHLSKFPDDAEAHAQLALVLLVQGVHSKARSHSQKALALDPQLAYAHYVNSFVRFIDAQSIEIPLYGEVLIDGFAFRAAQRDMERALKLQPEVAEFHVRMAQIQLLAGRTGPALKSAKASCRLGPMEVRPVLILQEVLRRRGEWNAASNEVQAALTRLPDALSLQVESGWIELARGRVAEARAAFLGALRLDPHLDRAHQGLLECARRRFVVYRGVAAVRSWLLALPVLWRLPVAGGLLAAGIGLVAWVPELVKGNPAYAWISPSLFGVFMGVFLLLVFGEALFGWLAGWLPDGRWPGSWGERRLGLAQLGLLALGVGGAVLAIVSRTWGRPVQWSLLGLMPGLYGIWVVRQIPSGRGRRWSWGYVAFLFLAGIPVAQFLESRMLRIPGWGVLLALVAPILPVVIYQDISVRRQRERERQELKEIA